MQSISGKSKHISWTNSVIEHPGLMSIFDRTLHRREPRVGATKPFSIHNEANNHWLLKVSLSSWWTLAKGLFKQQTTHSSRQTLPNGVWKHIASNYCRMRACLKRLHCLPKWNTLCVSKTVRQNQLWSVFIYFFVLPKSPLDTLLYFQSKLETLMTVLTFKWNLNRLQPSTIHG